MGDLDLPPSVASLGRRRRPAFGALGRLRLLLLLCVACHALSGEAAALNGTNGSGTASFGDLLAKVSYGAAHACALVQLPQDPRGTTVKCWGKGDHGQLGHGKAVSSAEPVEVVGISEEVVAVSAGGLHSCAVEKSGRVKCWGENQHGQLGFGGRGDRTTAELVIGARLVTSLGDHDAKAPLHGVIAVSCGGSHTCALLQDGTVRCWGWGYYGQLGQGLTGPAASRRYPVEVEGLSDVIAISCGGLHTCAIERGGHVRCWGYGARGQLGSAPSAAAAALALSLGGTAAYSAAGLQSAARPQRVPGLGREAVEVACGYVHCCIKTPVGMIECWGEGVDFQLQELVDVWEKTAQREMLLSEAVRRSVWPSPGGAIW